MLQYLLVLHDIQGDLLLMGHGVSFMTIMAHRLEMRIQGLTPPPPRSLPLIFSATAGEQLSVLVFCIIKIDYYKWLMLSFCLWNTAGNCSLASLKWCIFPVVNPTLSSCAIFSLKSVAIWISACPVLRVGEMKSWFAKLVCVCVCLARHSERIFWFFFLPWDNCSWN